MTHSISKSAVRLPIMRQNIPDPLSLEPIPPEEDQTELPKSDPPAKPICLSILKKKFTTQNCHEYKNAKESPIESFINSVVSAFNKTNDIDSSKNEHFSPQKKVTENNLVLNDLTCFICQIKAQSKEALTDHMTEKHSIVMTTENSKQNSHVDEISKSDPKLNGKEAALVHLFGNQCDVCDFKSTATYCLNLHVHQIHLKTDFIEEVNDETENNFEDLSNDHDDYLDNHNDNLDNNDGYLDNYLSDEDFKPQSFLKVEYAPDFLTNDNNENLTPKQSNALEDDGPLYSCAACDKQFENEVSLQQHMSNYHTTSHPCSTCSETFETRRALANHRRSEHHADEMNTPKSVLKRRKKGATAKTTSESKTKFYRCHTCKQKFDTVLLLRIHQRSEHSSTFKCKKCREKFEYHAAWKSHSAACTNYICLVCKVTLKSSSALIYHKRREHPKSTFYCEQCGKLFREQFVLDRHIAMHHKSSHDCPLCPEIFANFKEFSIHKRSKHPSEGLYLCDSCPSVLTSRQSLATHISYIHRIEGSVTCPLCKLHFRTPVLLNNHTKQHHDESKPHHCQTCQRTFDTDAQLTAHNIFHLRKTNHCEQCSITFPTVGMLDLHTTECHDTKHTCKLCSFETDLIRKLRIHEQAVHPSGEKLTCEICGKVFKVQKHLNCHNLRVHQGALRASCSYCGKEYFDKAHLKIHIRAVHLGIKDYVCDLCGKAFAQKQNLQKHVNGVHKKTRDYLCRPCRNYFSQSSSLILHMKRVHKIENPIVTEADRRHTPKTEKKKTLAIPSAFSKSSSGNGDIKAENSIISDDADMSDY